MESDAIDRLDWALLEALARVPRVPFSRLARVLGVSDQTAARRYQRLRQRAGLRIVAQVVNRDPDRVDWSVRLQCTPDAAAAVASALADRDDTVWVQLASGGTEVICAVSSSRSVGGSTLFEKLTGSRRVVGISAHSVLHRFSPPVWPRLAGHLDAGQLSALQAGVTPVGGGVVSPLDGLDQAMLELLSYDGRTPAADIAAATGRHESTVRRRIEQLQRSGQLAFEMDLDYAVLGLPIRATLWMSVIPTQLDHIGEALAARPEVGFVAATTGPTNLTVSVLLPSSEALYEFLTQTVGSRGGVTGVEISPIMRTLKRHGPRASQPASPSPSARRRASQ